ncbi:MAG TPA: glycosyltransferase, partial [Bryobacteraceae bacterium]|nr:glycosyltransferase [Bryobacteraceae bacterium]
TIDRADVIALVNCCDCLISLHRCEGFGLTLAEAMFLGKPVIASAYSGAGPSVVGGIMKRRWSSCQGA